MRLLIICLFLTCLLCACAPSGIPYSPPGEGGFPEKPPTQPSQEEAVALAKQHLAAELKISPEQITVVSIEKVDWPDTSLGLPKPDMAYAQVIVPGFKITLRALEQDYVYHAGVIGNKMVVLTSE
jgi:hypothetical protein